ncbi:MAG TPA: isoprenylcysteine carboxylmethyltransferase family protein [Anaerohalosphaeraceae bacterium]|jgi:protein-S-isoprenylcysteine O-methyltransferase Ste14|nr:isoprenylcysteine carboxylmethyltransferase family protein [Anaerohalosphaeraceae bacterium]
MTRDRLNRNGYKVLAGYFASPVLHGAIIFGCAGRMDLPWIWVYLVVSFIGMFGGIVPVCIRNPVLINHRGDFRRKKDTMPWDRWLVPTYGILSCYLTPAVIGLDVGRYGWSDLGPVTAILGIAGFLAGSALLTWAMLTNTHFETTVRIQTDRNHKVVTTGPYRFVRHPGYVGAILWNITTPMMARSAAALVPAVAAIAVLVCRTSLEDRTLRCELPGYAVYADRTRYRLLPGIW